ncbi:MAG TPA: TonB-dependent receptor [Longimicrobium sp.]|nr:TonB-dependent receptor [Longimicrobium sp.]
MRALTLLCGAIALLATSAPAAHAQGLFTGVVVDNATNAPIEKARVTLMNQQGRRLRTMETAANGRFSFSPVPGYYRFRVERVGYVQVNTAHIRVVRDSVDLEIRMRDDAVMLAPVTVVARAGRVSPVLAGFYSRMENGFGRYITREAIEQRQPGNITDMLRTLPGVRTMARASGFGSDVVINRVAPRMGGCPVQIFLDGIRVNRSATLDIKRDSADSDLIALNETIALDDLADPSELEGIEVYYGLAGVPAEFMGPDARCGTVAVWTRER